MKNLHIKFPGGLLERLDAQRQKDRLSPGRSEFIRRLLDLQLSKMEVLDSKDKTRRQSQIGSASHAASPVDSTALKAPGPPVTSTGLVVHTSSGPQVIDDYTIEIEMPDGSMVRGLPKNASPELLARLKAEGARQPEPPHVAAERTNPPAATKSEELEEPADLGDAKSARGLLGNLLGA
jgi:Arc/MetJ-type ribon-helix-helix transcriptional regulator